MSRFGKTDTSVWIFRNEECAGLLTDSLWYNIDVNCDNKKDMCDICPSDSVVIAYLIGVAFIAVIFSFAITKKAFLSFIIFSVLINLIFLSALFLKSSFFRVYEVEWLQYLSLFIWPVINIILVIWYVRRKK